MTLDEGMEEGRRRRDRGAKAVSIHNLEWRVRYLQKVLALPSGWTGTGEDLRIMMGDDAPDHHNAWGAAMLVFVRSLDLFKKTGVTRNSRLKRSHARMQPVYIKL